MIVLIIMIIMILLITIKHKYITTHIISTTAIEYHNIIGT